jgi:hypothetical protein
LVTTRAIAASRPAFELSHVTAPGIVTRRTPATSPTPRPTMADLHAAAGDDRSIRFSGDGLADQP